MQPSLSAKFLLSATWTSLSPSAQATLRGLLAFAIHHDCDWSVEASAQQIAAAVGPAEGVPPAAIVTGLRELETVGCVRRFTRGRGFGRFVLCVPLDEGPRVLTPIQRPA